MLKIIKDLSPAFGVVTALIFGLGFIAANNEPLLTALKAHFSLNWTQALLIQIIGLLANGIVAIPAAILLGRIGSSKTIIIALCFMFFACFSLQISFVTHNYILILCALFIMASGLSTLQVASNPLIAVLGHEDFSHFRLTLAQTFNSLGVVIGVHFGTKLLLSPELLQSNMVGEIVQSDKILNAVSKGYMVIGILVALLIIMIISNARQIDGASKVLKQDNPLNIFSTLKEKWAVFGAIAIGLYVGAEVSIASVMINFLGQSEILGLSTQSAGSMLAYIYWGGALIGRFLGSAILTRVRAPLLLIVCGISAAILCLIVILKTGPLAGYAALGVGFFNSIMFPIIFTMTLRRTNSPQPAISGLLCLAISGGALLALGVGRIADIANLNLAFIVPMLAYLFIFSFAVIGNRIKPIRLAK